MPNILSSAPGAVVSIGEAIAMPLKVTMTGWGGYTFFKSIMTEAAVNRSGRYQFLYSLRDFIYLYVFGEALGEITISGVAFSNVCPGEGVYPGAKSGFEYVLNYYEKYRLSLTGSPVILTIGTTGFQAFLTNIAVVAQDPEKQLSMFKMRFLFPPNPKPVASFDEGLFNRYFDFVGQFLPVMVPSYLSMGNRIGTCCLGGGALPPGASDPSSNPSSNPGVNPGTTPSEAPGTHRPTPLDNIVEPLTFSLSSPGSSSSSSTPLQSPSPSSPPPATKLAGFIAIAGTELPLSSTGAADTLNASQ